VDRLVGSRAAATPVAVGANLSTQHKGRFSCFQTAGHRALLGPISIYETDHLFTKQLLCQLSYASVDKEGSGTLLDDRWLAIGERANVLVVNPTVNWVGLDVGTTTPSSQATY
jgi:hypothetical protein